ncbi:MAG: SH3 domain-containing protein [Candidatus Dojkabacteria bacterium]
MKKIFVLFTTLILVTSLFGNKVSALTIVSRADLGIQGNITKEDLAYSLPQETVIAPIFLGVESPKISQKEWVESLYYYTIEKLGFTDLPFHYIVTSTGEVYQGNLGGDERKVKVDGIGANVILIAYLASSKQNSFDPKADNAIKGLLQTISNKNSIKAENIVTTGIKFIKDTTNKTVSISSEEIFGNWASKLEDYKAYVAANYVPEAKSYTVDVSNIALSTPDAMPGEEVTGTVTIKNTGSNGLYGGTDNEIVASKSDGGPSQFFINNVWLSRSQFSLMTENQNILPTQETTLTFKIKAPLAKGSISETFVLKTLGGGGITASTQIGLTLNLKPSDQRIIQIQNTELGYLKVRGEPSTLGPEIGEAASGQRYFVLEDAGNGYLKIDLGNGTIGWVAGWLVDNI